jgi:hypothetical protein
MKTLTIQLSSIQITAPEYPDDCVFVEINSPSFSSKVLPEHFSSYEEGCKTLTEIIQLHNLAKHNTPDFQNEAFIDMENGVKCCIGDDYIRFVNSVTLVECESQYWTVDEIVEDFADVMGAIVGCMCSGEDLPH